MGKNKKVKKNPFYQHLEDMKKREEFKDTLRKKILVKAISHVYEAISHIENVETLEMLEQKLESEEVQVALDTFLTNIAMKREDGKESSWKDFWDKIHPLLDTDQVSEMLHITRQAVIKKIHNNQIIALKRGNKYVYPRFQFTPEGTIVRGLDKILKILDEKNLSTPFKIEFLISENLRLGGKKPIDLLRAGEIKKVERAAKSFGEMGV